MSNKNNYQSKNNNHQLPNDSFLYDLDVDDWSFLPDEEDKPDNNPTSDTDDPEPEYTPNEPKQETITPSKRVKEQAIAEVALTGSEPTKLELADLEPSEEDKRSPFVRKSMNKRMNWWDKRSRIGIDPLNEELASQKWWREERSRVVATVYHAMDSVIKERNAISGEEGGGIFDYERERRNCLNSIRTCYDNPGWSFVGAQAKSTLFGHIDYGYDYEQVESRYREGSIDPKQIMRAWDIDDSLKEVKVDSTILPEVQDITFLSTPMILTETMRHSEFRLNPGTESKINPKVAGIALAYGAEPVSARATSQLIAINQLDESTIKERALKGVSGQLSKFDFLRNWDSNRIWGWAIVQSERIRLKALSDKDKYIHARLAVEEMLSDLGLKEAIKLQYGNIPSQPDRKYAKYDKMILNSGAVTPKRYTQLANDILQRDVEDNLEAMRDMVDIDTSGLFLRVFGKRYLQANNNADEIVPKALLEILGDRGGAVDVRYCSNKMQAISDTLREYLGRREKIRQGEQKPEKPGSRDALSDPHPVVSTDKEHEINYQAMCIDALHYFRKEETKWGKQLAKVNEFRKQHPQLNNAQRDEVLLELQKAYEVTAYYDSKVKRILGITKDDKQSTREYRMKTLLIDQVVKQVDGSKDESLWKWCQRRLKKFQAELADQARA